VVEMPANEAKKELPANEIVSSKVEAAQNNRFTNDEPVKRKDRPLSLGPTEMYQVNESESGKSSV
jgi:hypothetical protein